MRCAGACAAVAASLMLVGCGDAGDGAVSGFGGARAGTAGATGSAGSSTAGSGGTAGGLASGSPPFTLMSELYADARYHLQKLLDDGIVTGVSLHVPLTSSDWQFLQSNVPHPPVVYYAIPSEANVSSCYMQTVDDDAASTMASLGQLGSDVWRLGMPEFDQWGGCWANGRPPLGGMMDEQAYDTWTSFYLDTKGMRPYLEQTAEQRGYKWLAMCVYGFCPAYAYEMGADAVLLERHNEEIGAITPGLAMMRGAARQYGDRPWGIDLSSWRFWSYAPTTFDDGKLVAGWSPSMTLRHLFIAFMGGAELIHNEASNYTAGAASGNYWNPLALTIQSFHDFAVERHPNRGTPYVPFAIVHDHFSGFEHKHLEWEQGSNKWYQQLPYSAGDTMFASLLHVAYPDHETWGRLVNGAPKMLDTSGGIDIYATAAAYNQMLVNGADPRPMEPMGTSRWGETFDVLTDRASLEALNKYSVVVLSTTGVMGSELRDAVTQFVQQGGVVVLNAQHVNASDEALTGLHLTAEHASATSETWVADAADGMTISEAPYSYRIGVPTTTEVLARTAGNPIVTKNVVGHGMVYVTTPDYLVDSDGASLLNVGIKLIDDLQSKRSLVRVEGPSIEYLVGTDGNRILVTLVNNDLSAAAWNGMLAFKQLGANQSVEEWVHDTMVPSSMQNGAVVVDASVPSFDVSVYVLSTN